MKLSAIIIAKNEEKRIATCLKSLSWAGEIIVVDNGSTDQTVEIAKQYGAKIYTSVEKDFSSVRELGLEKAARMWVLYIDADEEVPEELREEICRVIKSEHATAYLIRRDTYFLGYHWPYQDAVERLFLKSALKGWHGKLHETPVYTGSIGSLQHPMIHRTHRTLEEMVKKTNDWSVIEAELRFKGNHPPVVWWRLIRVMITGFFGSYIGQRGWRAGTVGLIESVYQAFSLFITYAKLWELQQKKIKKVVNKNAIA